MSVILSVQMAMGYTVNPLVSVLHSSDGQKKWQHMKWLVCSSASFVKKQMKTAKLKKCCSTSTKASF